MADYSGTLCCLLDFWFTLFSTYIKIMRPVHVNDIAII